jgi:hypothetical protein
MYSQRNHELASVINNFLPSFNPTSKLPAHKLRVLGAWAGISRHVRIAVWCALPTTAAETDIVQNAGELIKKNGF